MDTAMTRFLLSIAFVVAIGAGAAGIVLRDAPAPGMRRGESAWNPIETVEFTPCDVAPKAVKEVRPEYPSRALSRGLEGDVHLKVHVSADGIVKQAVVLRSDNPAFNQAAQIAAMQWEFTPARKGGKQVDVWIPLPMRFKLKELVAIVPQTVQ